LPKPDVRSIAVLRPNALGDFVFTLPALRALRETWPRAHIVYLGQRWHVQFVTGRGFVDQVLELPRVAGVTAPDEDPREVENFCKRMRALRFDLALQLFGGGSASNPLAHRLGARLTAGLRAAGAPPLDLALPYVPLQNERLRLLEAVALVGARTADLMPRLPVLNRDRSELARALPLPEGALAVLQPGAKDPRRRWPAERFAEVGDALAREGATVVVNGSPEEAPLTRHVTQAMRAPAIDAAGRLSLGGLAALLARAQLLVSNDTGPLHLAQAIGTPTVGIYWLSNLLVSAPLRSALHRPLMAVRTRCPECDAENVQARCPHDPSFVAEVAVAAVLAPALELWRTAARCSGGTARGTSLARA
jgi:ADP-heptose:LPS heptosyltransferase